MLSRTTLAPALALALPLVVAGCEEKKAPVTKPVASADAAPTIDPKVARAMASAAAARSAKAADGPPEAGVFTPAAADKAMPKGTLKIELSSEGEAPRVTLKPMPWKGTLTTRTSMRLSRAALPNVDLVFALGSPDKKDDKDAPPSMLTATVKKVELSREQPGQLPKDAEKEIAKVKGGVVELGPTKEGAVLDPKLKPGKDSTPEIEMYLAAGADALFFTTIPVPPKPVGVGATWIAGSRQIFGGTEVIVYRMIKVEKIEGDKVTLSVKSTEYQTGGDLLYPPGVQKGAPNQFQGVAAAEVVLSIKDGTLESAEMQHQSVLAYGTDPQNPKGFQLQLVAKVFREEKKKD